MKYNKKSKKLIEAILEFNPNITVSEFSVILRGLR